MKRFVIVGLGNFGSTVARELHRQGHEVVAVDRRREPVDAIADHVDRAAVADGTVLDTLKRIGAADADVGIVSTGDDISACVLATLALLDAGVKEVVVKTISLEHARIMRRLGASDTVFPEHDSAMDLAAKISDTAVLNYMRLGGGFSIQEMIVPDAWEGRTLRDLALPINFRISVVGVHDVLTDRMSVPPDPDVVLKESDTLIVAGTRENLHRVAQMK